MLSEYSADVFDINYKHIRNINQDRYRAGNKVQYIKCPVCGILMNRINFGYRSGVIVDSCKSHGVWLDNGEITHLLEWRKAGGQLLHEINVQRSLARRENFLKINRSGGTTVENLNRCSFSNSIMYEDLLNSLSSVIFKLFE